MSVPLSISVSCLWPGDIAPHHKFQEEIGALHQIFYGGFRPFSREHCLRVEEDPPRMPQKQALRRVDDDADVPSVAGTIAAREAGMLEPTRLRL